MRETYDEWPSGVLAWEAVVVWEGRTAGRDARKDDAVKRGGRIVVGEDAVWAARGVVLDGRSTSGVEGTRMSSDVGTWVELAMSL